MARATKTVVNQTPVETTPVETTPVETTPVETTPVEKTFNERVSDVMSKIQDLFVAFKQVQIELKDIKAAYNKETKQRKKPKKERSLNAKTSGFTKPIQVSKDLESFLGLQDGEMISRPQITSRINKYIIGKNLFDPENKSNFTPDKALQKLLGGPRFPLSKKDPSKGNGYNYLNLSLYLKDNGHFVLA
jgi:chromatin remodeling complex protein RSC6